MKHQQLTREERERAALFALGALPEDEAATFGQHLTTCEACSREVKKQNQAVVAVADTLPLSEPPAQLKQELFSRLGLNLTQPAEERPEAKMPPLASGPHLTRIKSNEMAWKLTDIPGVSQKILFVDQATDLCTMLVKMEPGTRFPAHIHRGPEEIFVLEGDFCDGSARLGVGDFQRAEGDTRHGWQSTESGCLLLVRASRKDSVLQNP